MNDRLSEYDYLIRYIEIKKVHGKTEKYGSIFIKGDSIITYYHSKPSIVGDPFSANPVISDSASIGILKNKIEKKRSGWIKRLEHLTGFYSQNTKLGSKEFYPHNWIQCLMIFNKSGICFGLISYGTHDVDYQIVGKSESDSLKELIDFVF